MSSVWWSKEEIEIIKREYPLNTKANILLLLPGRTFSSIQQCARKLGIKRDLYDWSEEQINLLIKTYAHSTKKELCELFPTKSWSAIKQKACGKLNLKKEVSGRTKNGNVEKLLLDDLISFYWMGLLLADGSFDKDGRMNISLGDKDKQHIEKLALFLNSSVKTYTRKTNFSDSATTHSISILSTYYGQKIRDKFDLHLNKTENPPDFSKYVIDFTEDQFLSLLIGFIDGDGYIHTKKDGKQTIKIEIHPSWKSNLEQVEKFIYSKFPYKKRTKVLTKINTRGYASLEFSNSLQVADIKRFAITKNLPFLERKWND
jgi:hypothetical protein